MNRHALTVLEFSEALDGVAGYAANPVGAEAVRALEPISARDRIETELRRVDEMMTFVLRSEEWTVPTIPDLREALARLGVEASVWEGLELRDAARLLEGARSTRRSILRFAEGYPRLARVARRLAKLEAEATRIRRAIDEHGEVRDDASKELARLRREIRAARGGIVERLERFIAGLSDRIRVPDASVTIREGRYVVPIRREGRSRVGGIVHDESATGGTLFVEPPVAIEWMNRLRDLELREAREVRRILGELTDTLRPHRDSLADTLDALATIDALSARARYALRADGHRPALADAGAPAWHIVRGRHPLLLAVDPESVVPFELRMEPGERTLLVSGPNTGGKTVLLKAIGLIAAMTQAGIIPPVGPGTTLPVFREIFADIGDEQSIEASLSTFSAHLKNLREIIERADGHALVLIDEIGSGTDPAEGGALARAILVELTRRGTLTVATSHLGQLKLLAGEEEGVVNASLQFDAEELRPTYRLVKGVPGRSYGLAIARRLGFPEAVVERAESYQPSDQREVGELLREMEAKERRLAERLEEAAAAAARAEARERELEEREAELRRQEADAERRSRQQARDLLMHAREQVEAAIGELREAVGREGAEALEAQARRARRRVEEAAGRQAERMPENRSERG
ncbi:MAG: endonuclease MutS2, partial [Gemmatimonadota bacterium]